MSLSANESKYDPKDLDEMCGSGQAAAAIRSERVGAMENNLVNRIRSINTTSSATMWSKIDIFSFISRNEEKKAQQGGCRV